MGLDVTSLNHACQVIRRQVLDEFKDLTLLFVVHKGAERHEAVLKQADTLLGHPPGQAILNSFKKYSRTNKKGFLGLVIEPPKKSFFLKTGEKAYALFFIDVGLFENMEEAKTYLYHQVWHALDLQERHRGRKTDSYIKLEGLITPKETLIDRAMDNLMADIFAAILLELEHGNDQVRALAARRSRLTLEPVKGYEAELFPYPVVMETVYLVLDDLRDNLDPRLKTMGRAVQLAREVAMTHDEKSIRQWWAFSTRAQEMAWMGFDSGQILNAALYTSEDPYVKATAYLVADALDVETSILTNTQFYNPFTDPEVNERNHNKACEALFQAVLSRVMPVDDPYYFFEEAKRQNEKLMAGHISGWCAPALLAAEQAYSHTHDENISALEAATQAYRQGRTEFNWVKTQKLAHVVMKLRRIDFEFTPESVKQLGLKHADLEPAVQAMIDTLTRAQTHETDAQKEEYDPPDPMQDMANMLPGYKDKERKEETAH